MASELKPCPFCGAGETTTRTNQIWTGMSHQIISAEVNHFCPKDKMQNYIMFKAKTLVEAIELWNRRA